MKFFLSLFGLSKKSPTIEYLDSEIYGGPIIFEFLTENIDEI